MKLDIQNLFDDYNISYQTEGHKHCRPGWINIECPFCSGNPGYHLGFCIQHGYFTCWRCGNKRIDKVISKLLGISSNEAGILIKEYASYFSVKEPKNIKPRIKAFKYPSDTIPLTKRQAEYLKSRGFNIGYLKNTWRIDTGTGPASRLDEADYKHRILIPISVFLYEFGK